jgi:hypothetical protein
LVELRARAALGITLMTQLRGNYPEMLRSARRARRFARQAHLPALESRSAYALMVAAAQLGHDGEALVSAWEMYVAASVDPDERATSLVALGQLLLRLGQSAAAYNAFAMVIPRRASPRVLLRALSGLASAGARREAAHRAEVLWAADEVRRLRGPASPRYDLANALLECAVALDAIDETGRARVLRDEALALGEAHGFHQVVLEAEKEKQTVGTRRLPARASEVVRHFADAPAPRRPAHVRPTGAALVG